MLENARDLYARGQLDTAEQAFREVLEQQPSQEEALRSVAVICLQTGRSDEALRAIETLVKAYPEQPLYHDRYATLLEASGNMEAALEVYRKLLQAQPGLNNSRHHYARLLKRDGRAAAALEQYSECLRRGIDHQEETHTDIGVVLGDLNRQEEAEKAFREALRVRPGYLPALYNLGLLQEERGDWHAARITFTGIVDADPSHSDAMARLAHGETWSDPVNPVVRKIKRALGRETTPAKDLETLHYALGKVFDDCGQYDEAFHQFQAANQYSRQRVGAYDPIKRAAVTDQIITGFNEEWLSQIEPVSDASLIFICGMFRSGSTLLEQILGAHPVLQAGGEINYFPRSVRALAGDYPASVLAPGFDLAKLGRGYLETLDSLFPQTSGAINKRPDNDLYLGLIKGLFPNARFLHTDREPMDVGISIYSQSLAAGLDYANDLAAIGHHMGEQRRLMDHWRRLFADSIHDVSYEELVSSMQDVVTGALNFLELEWHDDCLRFHETANRVRTASVSQVRRELYSSSVGRWKNYATYLEPLKASLDRQD